MKIGIFDSGFGGLCLLLCSAKMLSNAEFLYFADTDNVPYGEKSKDTITRLSDRAVGFLTEKGADAVVVACNTATSAAIKDLREKYENDGASIPIVGMEPAVKRAIDICQNGRILAAATPLTVRGEKLKNLLERFDKSQRTDTLPLPGLVRLAESGDFDSGYDYIKSEITAKNLDVSLYSALVLGCTHFNYFKDSFSKILPENTKIVDGNAGTVNQLLRRINADPSPIIGDTVAHIMKKTEFFSSGRPMSEDKLSFISKCLYRLEEMEKI